MGRQRGRARALPVTAKCDCEPIMRDGRDDGGGRERERGRGERPMGRLHFVRGGARHDMTRQKIIRPPPPGHCSRQTGEVCTVLVWV